MANNHSNLSDDFIGKYKATKGLYTFEVIGTFGSRSRRFVQFRDKTSVPVTLLTEMLLRREIVRTT